MKYRVKILFKILLILSLSILVVCIIFFMKNQSNTIKNDAVVSSKQSKNKTKSKENNTSKSDRSNIPKENGDSEKGKPNEGKTLYFNTVNEAEDTINQHRATCPYGGEPFYPGLVYWNISLQVRSQNYMVGSSFKRWL